jgi:porphobilinogen synthase
MIRETEINPTDFIYPLFVRHGKDLKQEIRSMPGNYQWSVDNLAREAKEIADLGIPGVILFGIPNDKDPVG